MRKISKTIELFQKSGFFHLVSKNKKNSYPHFVSKAILYDSNWVLIFLSKLLPYATGSVYRFPPFINGHSNNCHHLAQAKLPGLQY